MLQLTLIRMDEGLMRDDVEKDAWKIERAWKIDRGMLLLFALLYILFNLLYWPVCLAGQSYQLRLSL